MSFFLWHSTTKSMCDLTRIRLARVLLYLFLRLRRVSSSSSPVVVSMFLVVGSASKIMSSSSWYSMDVSVGWWADPSISGSGIFWARVSLVVMRVGSSRSLSRLADPTPLPALSMASAAYGSFFLLVLVAGIFVEIKIKLVTDW